MSREADSGLMPEFKNPKVEIQKDSALDLS